MQPSVSQICLEKTQKPHTAAAEFNFCIIQPNSIEVIYCHFRVVTQMSNIEEWVVVTVTTLEQSAQYVMPTSNRQNRQQKHFLKMLMLEGLQIILRKCGWWWSSSSAALPWSHLNWKWCWSFETAAAAVGTTHWQS